MRHTNTYSHLSNNRGGCNKRGGGAKVAKINKRGGWNKRGRWDFLEINST